MRALGSVLPALAAAALTAACSAPARPGPARLAALQESAEHAAEHASEGAHGSSRGGGEGHSGIGHGGAGTEALSLFLGGTDELGSLSGFAIGLSYAYWLTDEFGVGAFMEGVTGDGRSLATGFQGYWHAVSELVLVLGAGVERRDGDLDPIVRVGGFYEFEVAESWALAPGIFYDFNEKEGVLVYGLELAYVW
ncbi:MAG: hypothetical protein AAGB93_07430 [Planctomycetota bacterium]